MERIPLSQHCSYRIGGPARYFCAAADAAELTEAVMLSRSQQLPFLMIGGGTNLLISDAGFSGVVARLDAHAVRVEGTSLIADAGALMADVVAYAAARGLTGLEWAGGLPGTLGGAIRGNAGAFSGETKDSVTEVTSLNIRNAVPTVKSRDRRGCRFGYRTSVFKEGGEEIILAAQLQLGKGDPGRIRAATEEKIQYRLERHPMEYPNVGSIFKNVALDSVPAAAHARFAAVVKTDPFPVIPAAYLIAQAGLKGISHGGAMISPKHPNFIVNVLAASAADVKALIGLVKATVAEKFSIGLEEEIMYV